MSVPQLVNHVAQIVGRPALLEDGRRRMVAYSPQHGVIDEVRRNSILRHLADPDVRSWLDRTGVYRAERAVHVPGNRGLGMLPRLVVPIRRADASMGHLWFIEAPDSIDDHAVARADEFAERIAEEWARAKQLLDLEASRSSDHARQLLLGTEKRRFRAAENIVGAGGFLAGDGVRAFIVRPAPGATAPDPMLLRDGLERTARQSAKVLGFKSGLALVRKDHLVLVAPADGPVRSAGVDAAAMTLLDEATSSFGPLSDVLRVDVGVGGAGAGLHEARASYGQARRAVQIAGAFGLDPGVQRWDQLRAYRGLHAAAARGLRAADFRVDLDRLREERDGAVLIETLEVYLRVGGRAQEAAALLSVHRSSLYHRLARVERILDLDLQDGVQRLGLHLGILLAKLDGAPPAALER